MADIQSTLSFQDRMSSVLQSISRRLEDASTSADIARNHLQNLEQTQKQYSEAVKAAIKVHGANSAEVTTAMNAYDRASKEYDKGAARLEKYNKQVISAQMELKKQEQVLREYNGTAENTNNQNKKMGLGFESLQGKIVTLSAAFQLFNQAKAFIQGINSKINEYIEYTRTQMQAEDQLAIISKQRMALNDGQVRSLYDLASAQQKVGVVGDEAVITGMAGIAAFTKQKSSIEALTPAMNNLAVKMYGYNVNAQNMEQLSKSLGRAMLGDVGALSRMGVKITDVQKKRLMQLNEEQRAIELSKMITAVTGNMNEEMAKTPFGQMQQATNRLGDSYERLGAMFLPFQAKAVEFWSNLVETVVNNMDKIVPIVTIGLATISAAFVAMKWQAITAWVNAAAPIIAVVGAIAGVSIALDKMGISFQEQAENILISINWVMTMFKNIPIVAENVGIGIMNVVQTIVPTIQLKLNEFFTWIIDNLKNVAENMDKVFHTNVASGITNISQQLERERKKLKEDIKAGTNPYKDYEKNDIYTNTQKAKEQMKTLRGEFLNNRKLLGNTSKTGGLTGLEGFTTNTSGGKALKTQNQGKVEFAQDNLELLHDIATQKYAQYFQQLTPNLNISNMNISNEIDVDMALEAFANAITGSIQTKLA